MNPTSPPVAAVTAAAAAGLYGNFTGSFAGFEGEALVPLDEVSPLDLRSQEGRDIDRFPRSFMRQASPSRQSAMMSQTGGEGLKMMTRVVHDPMKVVGEEAAEERGVEEEPEVNTSEVRVSEVEVEAMQVDKPETDLNIEEMEDMFVDEPATAVTNQMEEPLGQREDVAESSVPRTKLRMKRKVRIDQLLDHSLSITPTPRRTTTTPIHSSPISSPIMIIYSNLHHHQIPPLPSLLHCHQPPLLPLPSLRTLISLPSLHLSHPLQSQP